MQYNFLGFKNWKPRSGDLDLFQSADVLRASLSSSLPRSMCEGCICWREHGTCVQVQVEAWDLDAQQRQGQSVAYKNHPDCTVFYNCCPILFFDFIGVKLPELKGLNS